MVLPQPNLQPQPCSQARAAGPHVPGSAEAISARGTAPSSSAAAKPGGFVTPVLRWVMPHFPSHLCVSALSAFPPRGISPFPLHL